jgi:hypothetical protein
MLILAQRRILDKINSSCLESKNGSLTVNNITGGNAPYYIKWFDNSFNATKSGLEAFKKDREGIFNTEKNALQCNVSMACIIYKTRYNYDNDPNF